MLNKPVLKCYLVNFINSGLKLFDNVIESWSFILMSPTNIDNIEYFLRAHLWLFQPITILEFHYQQRYINT